MSVNEHVLALVAMAAAIITILAVGTLIAAEVIHVGTRRTEPPRQAERDAPRPAERSSSAA